MKQLAPLFHNLHAYLAEGRFDFSQSCWNQS